MKVVLTGASGYVGGQISNALRTAGHEVISLSRRKVEGTWHRYSLGDDPGKLPWEGADVLVHAAHDFTSRSWGEALERNVRPGVGLFRAARDAGVARLVFISSMSAFEDCRSVYGRAKFALEREVMALGGISLRPGLVWGSESGGVMGSLSRMVTRLPLVPYPEKRGGLVQYLVHESDLGEVIERSVSHWGDLPAGPLVVAHPRALRLIEILRQLARDKKRKRAFIPVPWQLVHAGLRLAEAIGLKLPVRSDSLVGLVHSTDMPVSGDKILGTRLRPFRIAE